jgi:hypothetical protein
LLAARGIGWVSISYFFAESPHLSRAVKIAVLATISLLLVAGIALLLLYQAARSVPEFYEQAVSVDPAAQDECRDEFVTRASALASDLHNEGRWQSLFTADQINAWLALELSTNYPHLLPPELKDPRISITSQGATIGCRYQSGELDTVVSVAIEAFLHSPHVVAVRIRHARAGAIPVPLGQILDGISHAARELGLRLEWRKLQGDPVALITLPRIPGGRHDSLRLESIELRPNELFVAGTVGMPPLESSPVVPEPLRVPTVKYDGDEDQPLIGSAEKDTVQK